MIRASPAGVTLDVRVQPRASRSGLAGMRGDAVLVRLNAPPVDGAANDELLQVLSEAFDVPRSAITIVAGARSRVKRVHVAGIDVERARDRLLRHLN